jgi:hypothetical protein
MLLGETMWAAISAITEESERDLGFTEVDLAKRRKATTEGHKCVEVWKRWEFEDEEKKRNSKKAKKIYKDEIGQ